MSTPKAAAEAERQGDSPSVNTNPTAQSPQPPTIAPLGADGQTRAGTRPNALPDASFELPPRAAGLPEGQADIHTLIGLPGGSETLFTISATLIELDDEGKPVGYADVFTRIEQAAAHFERVGLGRDYVKQFIR